ncbi:MAG: transporter substrate-binding domain-containing protein [Clostridium sp.]
MKNGLFKKLLAFTLIGTMALPLMACGSNKEGATNKDLLQTIKEKGKITIGMSVDYAPYEFFVMEDGKKKMVGMDVDMMNEMAKDLGVEVEVKEMEFSTICDAVRTGIIDLGVSGLSPEPDRLEVVDFSDIYFEAEQGILINKNSASSIKSLSDLEGKKIGAQNGSIQASIAQGVKGAEVKLLPEVPTLIQDLISGNLDAVIVELPVADIQASIHDTLAVAAEKIADNAGGGSAIAIPKGQEALLAEVNKSIKKLLDEGKLDEFYKNAVELSKNEVAAE